TTKAAATPGVLAILNGADYRADGLEPIPHNAGLMSSPPDLKVRLPGMAPITTAHFPMPVDKARFVGEPLAMVIAKTANDATTAAELIDITYQELPAVVRASDALKPGAPSLWAEAPANLCLDIEVGDKAATDATFARAAHVVRLDTWAQ